MIENKADDEIYKALKQLLKIYKEESVKGRYRLFSENDILEEGINFAGNETASSLEEGLHQLGNLTYLALTGKDGNKDRSIKIDGYPKLEIFFWPVLEVLLSADKPTFEKVAEKISEIEEGLEKENKASGGRKIDKGEAVSDLLKIFEGIDKKIFEEIVEETKNRLYFENQQPESRAREEKGKNLEGHEAEGFLKKVFAWMKKSNGFDLSGKWTWSYSSDRSLINMGYSGSAIKAAGFADEVVAVDFSQGDRGKKGMENMVRELQGKRIVSICDTKSDRWYLKIVKKKIWQF